MEETDRIAYYLSGKLNKEELKAFEKELAENKELAKSVHLQRKTTELLQAHAWVETKDRIAKLIAKANKIHRLFMVEGGSYFSGCACGNILFMHNTYSNSNLYADYFSPYPDRVTTMSDGNNSSVVEAMELYNSENYQDAAKAFEQLRQKGSFSEELLLYEIISLTESGNGRNAVILFEQLQLQNKSLEAAFAWQKIMTYLALGESEKTLFLVNLYLKEGYRYQSEKAKQLKSDLESIWR